MAKNKRNKVIPLTKTVKKEHDKKSQLIEKARKYIDQYEYCYAFNYKNMTTMPMQELRKYFEDSKFLIGKNKVLQVALGRTEEDAYRINSYHLSNHLKGTCGLFFTNNEPDYIKTYFREYACDYYGAVGTVANRTVILPPGKSDLLDQFPPSMESQLRQLGLQLKLDNGKYYVLSDYVVCEEGSPLTPEQSKMINHLGIKMDEFKINILGYLKKNGEFEEVSNGMDL